MATCTAQITVGSFPGGWGGDNLGIGPGRIMYLVEGHRAAWVMEGVAHNQDEPFSGPVTWIPHGPDRLLSDALVMIALLLHENADVEDLIAHHFGDKKAVELKEESYVDLTELDGDKLRSVEDVAAAAVKAKLVVTAMEGSSIVGQLARLESCSMIAEVCNASWVRYPDIDGNLQTAGELPPEDPDSHRFGAIRI